MDAIRRNQLKLWEDELGFKLLSDIKFSASLKIISSFNRLAELSTVGWCGVMRFAAAAVV